MISSSCFIVYFYNKAYFNVNSKKNRGVMQIPTKVEYGLVVC